jgi:transcription initiation factor TFIIIB Brf1 subunit/transcription initiation factor TFIIB
MTITCPRCDTDNEIDYENGDDSTVCRCCEAIIGVDEDGVVYEL